MDLSLIEDGNGGELVKKPKDLLVIDGLQNMPYLAMFGGSVYQSTPKTRLESEQLLDWWGNTVLFPDDVDLQFNSQTERALNNTPLTSAGRALIEQAVNADLAFMRSFADVKIVVQITGVDRLQISIRIQEPDNVQAREFIFIWDATRNELTLPYSEGAKPPVNSSNSFDYLLNFNFEQ